jgi:pimeloyl-ACP methyl ester carboxylesterase
MMPPRPMLVIRGALSDILSDTTMLEMTQSLADAIAVTIPGRGHAPTLNEPAARAAIAQFLANSNTQVGNQPAG